MFKDKYYYIHKFEEMTGAAGVVVLGTIMFMLMFLMS